MKTIFTFFIIISIQTNVLSSMDDIFKKRKSEDTLQSYKKNKQSNSEKTEESQVNDLFFDEIEQWKRELDVPDSNSKNSNLYELLINDFIEPVSIRTFYFTINNCDTLQNHYQQDKNELIYQCNYGGCFFATKYESSLKTHKHIHTGEKPYSCQICLYTSITKSNITRHMKNHGANRQFTCILCNYSSDKLAIIERHLNEHHKLFSIN